MINRARVLGHTGMLNIHTGQVSFYGIKCEDIFAAFTFLKDLSPDHEYKLWSYRGKRCLENTADGWVYVQGRWLPDKAMAKEYIRNRKR